VPPHEPHPAPPRATARASLRLPAAAPDLAAAGPLSAAGEPRAGGGGAAAPARALAARAGEAEEEGRAGLPDGWGPAVSRPLLLCFLFTYFRLKVLNCLINHRTM